MTTDYSKVKIGSNIILKDRPCKILQRDVSRPGKHGHAKAAVRGQDLITDKKIDEILTHHSHISVPDVTRVPYELSFIDDEGYMCLMGDEEPREDICVPENDIGQRIRELFDGGKIVEVTLLTVTWKSGDTFKTEERVVDCRELKE